LLNFKSILDVTKKEWLSGLGITEDEIPDVVILEGSWWREERQKSRLSHLKNVRELDFPDIFWGKWKDKKIVFCMAYGAPRALEISHIFSKIGCKLVIQIGTCGGLQSFLSPGDIILPDQISCEDGVAKNFSKDNHVNASSKWIKRSKTLLTKLERNVYTGKHITFSSLFAETKEMYKKWNKEGYLSVEMETATTVAAAKQYDVDALSMVVVWDELTAGRRFMDPMTKEALKELSLSNEYIFKVALSLSEET
tara:strand:- start:121 stop:876 length:756 start_codon:yes stop_codon:yes gene_type:complete